MMYPLLLVSDSWSWSYQCILQQSFGTCLDTCFVNPRPPVQRGIASLGSLFCVISHIETSRPPVGFCVKYPVMNEPVIVITAARDRSHTRACVHYTAWEPWFSFESAVLCSDLPGNQGEHGPAVDMEAGSGDPAAACNSSAAATGATASNTAVPDPNTGVPATAPTEAGGSNAHAGQAAACEGVDNRNAGVATGPAAAAADASADAAGEHVGPVGPAHQVAPAARFKLRKSPRFPRRSPRLIGKPKKRYPK